MCSVSLRLIAPKAINGKGGSSFGMSHSKCAFCESNHLSDVINFGQVALAGAFLKPEEFATEKKYPLRIVFCNECYATQVEEHAPPEELFNDRYFYFSSKIGTLRDHFSDYAREVTDRFLAPGQAKVLEFGCNDGVLLKPLADQGIATVIGVDASKNVLDSIQDERLTLINAFFDENTAERVVAEHGELDMIMANNVFAHISDIQGATRAVHRALKQDGVFVFEVHYLGKVLEESQYDMMYHEHLYYYSMLSAMKHFERFGMVIFDIKQIPIHAGSIRFYVTKKTSRYANEISEAAKALEADERAKGYHKPETYRNFAEQIAGKKAELMTLLQNLRERGHSIVGYGASGRANTMLQYCGINGTHLDYMVDDAPAKQGFCTPGTHLEIFPSDRLRNSGRPDYTLVFAWSFFDEICKKNSDYLTSGGKMIVPLPEVAIR